MDLQLTGKSALVTGSTAGIGLAIAIALAREGATVTLNGRTQERVNAALATARAAAPHGRVHGLAADLATAAGAEKAIAQHPEIDVLVNNLGIFETKPFADIPDADWLRLFET